MDKELRDIVSGCKAGKHRSYEALHRRFYRVLYGMALRYCRSREEAEDIVQETFIKVFTHIASYSGDGAFEGWLKRILQNTAINHYRSALKLGHQVDAGNLENEDDSFEKIMGGLDTQHILKALHRLPEGYRMLVNLFAIDGYSHPEIASMLGISEGTSKSQLHKARKQLKEILKSDYQAYLQ